MTSRLRAVIIDDERLARVEMKTLLSAHPEIDVVAEAGDVMSAIAAVAKNAPDVVFLDIHLTRGDGFEIAEAMSDSCRIIFVTAYQEHAVRAFDVGAVDYLLKPVTPRRLSEAINRLRSQSGEATALDFDDRILLPLDGHYKLVPVRDIEWINAAGDYSEVFLTDQKRLLVLRSLKAWEQRLPVKHFVRVHRSAIVNIDRIEKVEEWFNASFRLHLKGRSEPLVTSRRYSTLLRERFSVGSASPTHTRKSGS
jgi:two-component system, LytTR family, response regulator